MNPNPNRKTFREFAAAVWRGIGSGGALAAAALRIPPMAVSLALRDFIARVRLRIRGVPRAHFTAERIPPAPAGGLGLPGMLRPLQATPLGMADQVKIKAGVDSSGVKTGLATIRSQFAGLRASVAGKLGGSLWSDRNQHGRRRWREDLTAESGRLQDLSDAFGVSAETLQKLGNVAKQSGGSLEDVGSAMGKLLVAQDKVRKGDDGMIASLTALGITQKEFLNLSPEDAFYRVADAVSKSDDDSASYAATLALMDRNAGTLFREAQTRQRKN